MRPPFRLLAVLALLAVLPGCEQLWDRGMKKNMKEAEQKAKASDYAGAIRLYERALDGTAESAEAHYCLALLYADKLKLPTDALHHFRRYKELLPAGQHVKEANEYQREGEQKLLAQFSSGNLMPQAEAARLKNEVLTLRTSLAQLRAQKAATPPPGPGGKNAPAGRKTPAVQKPLPANVRTHTVASGDTFGSIARKYYNSKARAQEIQDANFYPTADTPTIKPGMVLAVP